MYIVDGWSKMAEEDTYEDGCLPDTTSDFYGDTDFYNTDLKALIYELMEFSGADTEDAVLINACDVPGRIDIQVMEDEDGNTPRDAVYERWKKGEEKLWACTYTYHVEDENGNAVYLFPHAKCIGGFNLHG